ncbi:MAG: site-specific integrase [Candidatus Zixiibacteriota bacterium]|jgi:integrase
MGYRIAKRGKYYWLFGRIKGVRLDSSLRTTSKKEAEEIAKARVRKTLERVHGIRGVWDIRLAALLEKYLAYCEQNNRPSTYNRKRPFIDHILAYFGDVPLSSITTEQIEAFKIHRRRTVGPATVNREMAALKHALNLAVEWDYLEVSPAARVKKFKEPPGRVRYLNRGEADALVAACSPELRPVVVTSLNTGMRIGEILALEWADVDLKRRQLRIVDSKNNDSRVVPINEILYNALRSIRGRDGKVFLSSRGKPYQSIRTAFARALKEAGIDDFTFHDLRHTFASWLAMEGVPTSTIGKILGHKTPQMTMRYAHLAPDYLVDVVELLTQNKHKNKSAAIESDATT